MDQLFRDHIAFMAVGLLVGIVLAFLPHQAQRCQRLSLTILALSVLYPLAIVTLYARRTRLGESYAYLIYGDFAGILFGIVGGIAFLLWLAAYVKRYGQRAN